jgi:DNA-binding response OmpR family regulator
MLGNLLVVDDQPEICELIETHLIEQGHHVISVTDGVGARFVLSRQHIDLAIIDVLMPGEGGLSLAAWAAQQGVRVLLISGHPSSMDPPAGPAPHPLLRKPFRLTDLNAALASLLDGPLSTSH